MIFARSAAKLSTFHIRFWSLAARWVEREHIFELRDLGPDADCSRFLRGGIARSTPRAKIDKLRCPFRSRSPDVASAQSQITLYNAFPTSTRVLGGTYLTKGTRIAKSDAASRSF